MTTIYMEKRTMKTPKTSKLMTLLLSVGCSIMTSFFAHASETIAETPFELPPIKVDEIVSQKPNPIEIKKRKRGIQAKRAISETAGSANRDVSAPTNTFGGIGFNTPVFSDDDPLGFRALKEL